MSLRTLQIGVGWRSRGAHLRMEVLVGLRGRRRQHERLQRRHLRLVTLDLHVRLHEELLGWSLEGEVEISVFLHGELVIQLSTAASPRMLDTMQVIQFSLFLPTYSIRQGCACPRVENFNNKRNVPTALHELVTSHLSDVWPKRDNANMLVVTNRAGGTFTQGKEYTLHTRVTGLGGAVILLIAFDQLRLSKC